MRRILPKILITILIIMLAVLFTFPGSLFGAIPEEDLEIIEIRCAGKTSTFKAIAFDHWVAEYAFVIAQYDGTPDEFMSDLNADDYIVFLEEGHTPCDQHWSKTYEVKLPKSGHYVVGFYIGGAMVWKEFDVKSCIEYTPAGFIKMLYNKILWRSFTAAEKQAWLERYAMGWTAADMVRDFVFGEELNERMAGYSDGEFLTFLYGAILWRGPDTGGYDAFMAMMEAGMTREQVLDEFLASDEFIALCNKFKTTPYSGSCGTCGD
jgi:hypothetical protein